MGSLSVAYSKLFSVSAQVLFYSNGLTAKYKTAPRLDYKIWPSAQTLETLNRLDMVLKPEDRNGGMSIWVRIKGNTGLNKKLYFIPQKNDLLSFVFELKNSTFMNFNDILPSFASENLFFFDNKINDAAAPRTALHLSSNPMGVDSSDIYSRASSGVNYIHPVSTPIGTAILKHINRGIETIPKSHINKDGKAYISFDLTNIPPGKCELLIGGVNVQTLINLKERDTNSIFALVECHLDALLPLNYRIVENDGSITPDRPQYIIRFNKRSTIWRYNLRLEDSSPLFREIDALTPVEKTDFFNRLNILSNDTAVNFSSNILSDKEIEFQSSTPLPLQEDYYSSSSTTNEKLSLSLKKYIGNPAIETDVKLNLPFPSVNNLDARGAPIIYSDVLLNL